MIPPKLFQNKYDCCGCGSCYQKCPKNAIKMVKDSCGFIFPEIDPSACVGCLLCVGSCPVSNRNLPILNGSAPDQVFAARHKDRAILFKSSSGGAFTAIVQAIKPDFVVGARMTSDRKVVHSARAASDIASLRGSKYVQSDTLKTFAETKELLEAGKRVLYTGTPCQIAALKVFLKTEHNNLFTCDLICEGVTNQKLFDNFCEDVSKGHSSRIKEILFRDKSKMGWERSDLFIRFDDGKCFRAQTHSSDTFYMEGMMFLGSCRDSCYKCSFNKVPRQGDFTLGDLWGWREIVPEWNDNKGISLLMINTEKAKRSVGLLSEFLEMKGISLNKAARKNPNIIRFTEEPSIRKEFIRDLAGLSYKDLKKKYHKPRSPLHKLLSKIKFRMQ